MVEEFETNNRAELLIFAGGNAYKLKVNDIPDSKASQLGEFIPNLVGMEEKAEILGVTLSEDYSGNAVFSFENGKCAKVPLSAYETKSNRRKLTGAYSDKSPAVAMFFVKDECDILLTSSADKALCVSTEKIPLKTTRTTQGVNVMTLRKGATIIDVKLAADSGFADIKRYRSRNIPAAGAVIHEEDKGIEQMSFV